MCVNIEIVFLDFLKNDFLDLRGLWFGRRHTHGRRQLGHRGAVDPLLDFHIILIK